MKKRALALLLASVMCAGALARWRAVAAVAATKRPLTYPL